jgi:hypothetical protein
MNHRLGIHGGHILNVPYRQPEGVPKQFQFFAFRQFDLLSQVCDQSIRINQSFHFSQPPTDTPCSSDIAPDQP